MSDVVPQKRNVNKHTPRGQGLLRDSIGKYGIGDGITVAKNEEAISGSMRLETLAEIMPDVKIQIVETYGDTLLVNKRMDIDTPDTKMGRALSVASNAAASADWNPDGALLQEWAGEDEQIKRLFQDSEWQEITQANNLGVEKDAKPNPRKLPIDIIYTLQMADCTCCLAVQAGWKYGIQSAHYRLCPYTHELSDRHEVAFIDNDYFKYDHAVHLKAVSELRPKYATVRDVMTPEQCAEAKIEYYELPQILDWAEELAEHAQNVIVIPKYDCLDKIPDKFMLGYSVPTSHGGTPLPVKSFKGRRVHLLGGSWKAQLAHMAELGDDVVSLDNNAINHTARLYGLLEKGNGETQQLKEIFPNLNNPRYVALAISFGNIAGMVNSLYGGNGQPADNSEKDKTE
jgi:hypothetical protein